MVSSREERLIAAAQEVIAADGACHREEIGADRRWDAALAELDAASDYAPAAPRWPSDETAVRELRVAVDSALSAVDDEWTTDELADLILAALHGREETAGTEDGRG